jgi:hypothetical protein
MKSGKGKKVVQKQQLDEESTSHDFNYDASLSINAISSSPPILDLDPETNTGPTETDTTSELPKFHFLLPTS